MNRISALLFAVLVLTVLGCGGSSSGAGSKAAIGPGEMPYPAKVSATIGMVADLVRTVGRQHVDVSQICGPGVDPHLHKATRDDVQLLMSSDMIFYSGLMLEGKMSDTLTKMSQSKPVIPVTEYLDAETLLEPEDFKGHYDPHVWNDVSAWSKCAEVIRDELSKAMPNHAADFAANAKDLQQELVKLHEYGTRAIATVPEGSRVLVTSHDAFNYFGRAYGLEVLGVQGLSTESEAGLQRINDLIDLLVEKNVRSVFVENSVSAKGVRALVEGAQARGHEVEIADKELYSDAMGPDDSYEGTYIGMLDHNITVVTRGLGGEAEPDGLNGKLRP